MKIGKAGKAAPHAAYIAREGQYANRLDRSEKLEATEAGNMPAWAQSNPLAFWQAADAYERKNGTTYREMEIALPRELTAQQRTALVREFVRQEIGDRHAYQWAIHTPTAADGKEQPHVHLMFSERQRDGLERDPEQYFKRYNARAPEKGGARKGYGPNAGQTLTRAERVAELKALRGRWGALCNAHLERVGIEQRIDMRSHAERGTGLEPERKQLPSQWRGQGRANVIEFRQARAELAEARAELARAVPDARADVLLLEAERQRPEMTPAQRLAAFLSAGPIRIPGAVEGLPPANALEELRSGREIAPQTPAAWLGEAEQERLRQHDLIDRAGHLTAAGQSVLDLLDAQDHQRAAQQRQREQDEKARQEQRREAIERQKAEQERQLDQDTAQHPGDAIRAPRRSAQDWQHWRAHVLTRAYGDQIAASTLAAHWRVMLPRHGHPLTLYGKDGQSIADHGDRICPGGAPRWGQPLHDNTLAAALELARLKGWDRTGLDITGSSEFRERAARQAVRMGIPVANEDLQAIVADEQARMERQRQPSAFSAKHWLQIAQSLPTRPPAPAELPAAALEAQAFLGDDPTERRRRWDELVRRTQDPPTQAAKVSDLNRALDALIASRQARGLPTERRDAKNVIQRLEQYGWTSDSIHEEHQRAVDALSEQIDSLVKSGRRWLGSNRNAQPIQQLEAQRAERAKRGDAEIYLASDFEAIRPRLMAQEHQERLAAWQKDVALRKRIEPHAQAILERDLQQAKADRAARQERARVTGRKREQGPDRSGGPSLG
jgi:DNA-binding XRE family transcriptional regulator